MDRSSFVRSFVAPIKLHGKSLFPPHEKESLCAHALLCLWEKRKKNAWYSSRVLALSSWANFPSKWLLLLPFYLRWKSFFAGRSCHDPHQQDGQSGTGIQEVWYQQGRFPQQRRVWSGELSAQSMAERLLLLVSKKHNHSAIHCAEDSTCSVD